MMQYYISSSWVVSGSTWLTCHCVLECWTRWVSGIINQYSSSDVNKHGRIDLTGSEALFCLSIHVFWSAESNPVCIKWYFGGLILNPKMGNINSFLTNITMVLAVELFQQFWWNIVCKLLLNLSQSLLGQRWNTTKWIKSNIISCRYWHQGHWDGGWGSQYKVPESLQRYRLRPLSMVSFSVGATQYWRGQDGRPCVGTTTHPLPDEGSVARLPGPSRQPSVLGEWSRAACLPVRPFTG